MLHLFEPVADASTTGRFRRNPAIPVLIAVATGIVWDRMRPIPLQGWWLATFTMLLVSLGCRVFKGRFSVALLLMGCLGLGGLWHHWCWSCLAANDISRWAVDQGRIVHLTGKVVQAPLFIKSSGQGDAPWTAPERTVTLIECRRLIGRSSGSHEITGRARLSIIGRAESLKIGNLIDISGVLIRPDEPSNPGEFDFRRWMRAQGLHVTIAANFPEAIVVTGQECLAIDRVTMVRSAVRQRAERLMTSCLKPRTAAVAQSLLLGSRVELDRELRQAFAESGTLHVLAISGMNVGLLWCWMSFLCRMLRIPDRASLVCVLFLLPAYALVTDANPPVVRATIVAMVMAFGQSIRRCGSHWNSLALAALLVLGWNPSDLFNSGAQLSFVAVAAILLTMSFLRSVRMAVESEERPESVNSIGWNVTTWFFRKNLEAIIVSLGVWVMTSPLIAAQFHLVSPIGSALNVVLSPLIAVMFCLGYSFLLLGLISPQLFGWLGAPFEFTLEWFLAAVQTAAGWELGHNYVPAPPLWWTLGFYLIAFSTILLDHRRGRLFWSTRAVLAWSVFGLTFILSPAKSNGLRVTVCSVGHGLSVLIETPRGRTILYDAGGMAGGTRAARTVEGVLWSSGYSRLDAILISHADADHCNAVPELTGVIPTRTLLVHRTFLDWAQPAATTAIEQAASAGAQVRLVAAGQRIDLDEDLLLEILHPDISFDSPNDNSNSLVLSLRYAGRRILLTGDLEKDGLARLLRSDRLDTDVLLSPHHGSHAANTRDLARWSTPEWLLVSCRDDAVREKLEANFGSATQVVTTARSGAICCTISSNGDLSIIPYRQ